MVHMPNLNLEALTNLTEEQKTIASMIVATKGKNKGALRASKPKVDEANPITGKAAYVWRMVAFQLVSAAPYSSMPVTADFDLPYTDVNGVVCGFEAARVSGEEYSYQARKRAMAKELDALADAIVATVPRSQHHGINRWARALGYSI